MNAQDVDAVLAVTAQKHAGEQGHTTFLMSGEGWMCTSCDEDWEEVLHEYEGRPDAKSQIWFNRHGPLVTRTGPTVPTHERSTNLAALCVYTEVMAQLEELSDEAEASYHTEAERYEADYFRRRLARVVTGEWDEFLKTDRAYDEPHVSRPFAANGTLLEVLRDVASLIEAAISLTTGRRPTEVSVEGNLIRTDAGDCSLLAFRRYYEKPLASVTPAGRGRRS